MKVEEERMEIKLKELNMPKKFTRLFSPNFDSDIKEKADTYIEALRDILEPPSAPDRVEQIVREGFLQSPDTNRWVGC